MTEKWLPVPGTDGWYEVSSNGSVRSWKKNGAGGRGRSRRDTPRVLKAPANRDGYAVVCIRYPDRTTNAFAHVLAAAAFLGDKPPGMQVRHLDGNAGNNSIENLKYGTPLENQTDRLAHGTRARGEELYNAKLTEADVHAIRRASKRGELARLQRRLGISKSTLFAVRRGQTWKHLLGSETDGDQSRAR